MTPHSRVEILQKSLGYRECKIIQHRVVEQNSLEVKELRSGKQVKPRLQKQIQGPQTLERAYVEQEKTRIAATKALMAEKATKREVS